jgi:hypothetical protein
LSTWSLATPDAYDPEYKQWRLEHLPITPTDWKLAVTTPDLLKTIKSLLPQTPVRRPGDAAKAHAVMHKLHTMAMRGKTIRSSVSCDSAVG